jgi:hypothetical protein
MTPYTGETFFNVASPGATPSTNKSPDGHFGAPYSSGKHYTHYRWTISLDVTHVPNHWMILVLLKSISELGPLGGKNSNHNTDYSPDSAVYNVSHLPAARLTNAFKLVGPVNPDNQQWPYGVPEVERLVEVGDLQPEGLVISGRVCTMGGVRNSLEKLGVAFVPGIDRGVFTAFARYCQANNVSVKDLQAELEDDRLEKAGVALLRTAINFMKEMS